MTLPMEQIDWGIIHDATVLLGRHYSRDVMTESIGEAVEHVWQEDYARNDMVQALWESQSAHVVWLFVAFDPEDVRHANWFCRTEWIEEDLDESMRPTTLSGDEEIDRIAIEWNEQYETRKAWYQENAATKGEYLAQAKRIVDQMVSLGERAKTFFDSYLDGDITEAEFIAEMDSRRDAEKDLYRDWGNLPTTPEDCRLVFNDRRS